jgi:ribonuclease R
MRSESDDKAKTKYMTGSYTANPRGFGFVTVEGLEQDFFIPEGNTGGAINLDTVKITLLPKTEGRRQEALVVEILKHNIDRAVGLFTKMNGFGFVIPDDRKLTEDIYIPADGTLGAENNDKVVVTYTSYGNGREKKPEGRIIGIIGNKDAPGTDILSIVESLEIPSVFSQEVLKEAKKKNKPVKKKQMKHRLDLREIPMVTIDGNETKDFDDAVSIGIDKDGNYLLGVHIADVSEYVEEDSPLDKEALKRGTSVYLCDRVIPMLPTALSNGICSLNEGEDRLTLSCIMKVDHEGNVIDSIIDRSVVNIDHRMTYNDVTAILNGDRKLQEKYSDFTGSFFLMNELAKIIRKKRSFDGCIDFDFPESEILLNEDGSPAEVRLRDRNRASLIIEDFMILANETVAETFFNKNVPFLYRVHGIPDDERIEALNEYTSPLGITVRLGKNEIRPRDIQRVVMKAKGMPEEEVINHLVLRSMQKAKYDEHCEGHFGLAAKYYCHFTSPIRRYPDLQIHRIIKEYLDKGKIKKKREKHYKAILPKVAERTSMLERRADEAERSTDKMKKAEYMMAHIGEEYVGTISGVTAYGIYVELPNTIEGFIHISNLTGDFYNFIEERQELIGERTGKSYKIGQKVSIIVSAADKDSRLIDFILSGRR